ncbi:unnamed protein product [Ectocarpus sp. 12 AP-2014]
MCCVPRSRKVLLACRTLPSPGTPLPRRPHANAPSLARLHPSVARLYLGVDTPTTRSRNVPFRPEYGFASSTKFCWNLLLRVSTDKTVPILQSIKVLHKLFPL